MPEIAYLKQTNVLHVLSKALAETYQRRPNDPKTYFARWLLDYSNEEKSQHLVSYLHPLNSDCYRFWIERPTSKS